MQILSLRVSGRGLLGLLAGHRARFGLAGWLVCRRAGCVVLVPPPSRAPLPAAAGLAGQFPCRPSKERPAARGRGGPRGSSGEEDGPGDGGGEQENEKHAGRARATQSITAHTGWHAGGVSAVWVARGGERCGDGRVRMKSRCIFALAWPGSSAAVP
ncbi:uncharacterized protein BJ171DRAFT_475477 [Polychytrium aggregatum]|uniref:uncharacterized protein n=1 Tax=Polychytrium aggregatum TaxID=110093 RepID=UPI0022FF2E5E|nr:uncharacterized protein BJ171DRAFT_475477 [Polychytrium aggregatum]KAI9203772.1 hypothetical protein BJ171DRAFT_475477 [Polychytrium aggregatum]